MVVRVLTIRMIKHFAQVSYFLFASEQKRIVSSSSMLHCAAKRESIFMKHYPKKGNIEVHYVEYLHAK